MKNIVSKICILISITFSSVYLLKIIGMKASLNIYQIIFIFCYLFLLFIGMVSFIWNKGIGKSDKKSILIVSMISLLLCFFNRNIIVPRTYEDKIIEIRATGEKNESSVSYEVWINSITANGNKIEFEDMNVEESWKLVDGCLLSDTEKLSNLLKIQVIEMENVKITFGTHDWSGIVEVKCGDQIEKIDLYSINSGKKEINITGKYKNIGIEYICLLFGGYLTIFLFLAFFLSIFEWKKKYKWKNITICEILFAIMINNGLKGFFADITIIIEFILIIIVNFLFEDIKRRDFMQPYFTIKSKALIGLCNLYATFAIIGHFLFISGDNVIIDLERTIIFIIGFILFYPQMVSLIYLLKIIKNKASICRKIEERKSLKKVKIRCFLVMLIPLLIISLGYFPGSMTSDGVDQWAQAIGAIPIQNAHPAIHTLFLRICSKIAETPYTVVIAQIVIFVLIWTSLFGFLYEKGMSSKAIYIVALLIACMPNNYMMLCLISKNILYALIILWNMYLLIKLIDNSKNFFCWKQIIEFSIALALLNTVRHNGFLGTYVIWFVLIMWGIYNRKILKYKPFLIVGLSWLIILGINEPLYRYFDVQGIEKKASVSTIKSPLLAPAGMFILANEDIPDEGMKIVEKVGSIEEWKESYNPYNGDKLGRGNIRNNISKCSQEEAFQLYFILLKSNPLLVIKDRLNAIDILWNVIQPTDSYIRYGAYNSRYVVGIWATPIFIDKIPNILKEEIRKEYGAYFKENKLTVLGNIGIKFSGKNQLLDALFWRNGIYLILGILLVFINYIDKRMKFNIVILPAVATLCTLVFAASWQIYQYYWFFPLSIIFFGLFTLNINKCNK